MTPEDRSPAEPQRLPAETVRELAHAKRAARWVGLYIPLALTLLASVVIVLWLPRLPDPMATHWGGSGGPDGFGPVWSNLGISLGFGVGMTVLLGVMPFFAKLQPGAPVWGWSFRFLAASALACVTLIQLASLTTAYVQLDLADASTAPDIGGPMLACGAVALAVGVLGWFAQPKLTIAARGTAAAEPMRLEPNTRAVWFGSVRPAKPFIWIMAASGGLMLLFAILELVQPATDLAFVWIMLGCFALIAVLTMMNLWFRVRIDETGLEARAPFGWPVYRVAAADVAAATVVQVNPMGEFGGWGVRIAPGRFGIVMRAGEALEVARRSRPRTFTITVDDAETAASVLAGAAERASAE